MQSSFRIKYFIDISVFPEACETGKYGKGCSQNCGACLKSTVCNHITGTCGLGCEPGWQKTDTCTTGSSYNRFFKKLYYFVKHELLWIHACH